MRPWSACYAAVDVPSSKRTELHWGVGWVSEIAGQVHVLYAFYALVKREMEEVDLYWKLPWI